MPADSASPARGFWSAGDLADVLRSEIRHGERPAESLIDERDIQLRFPVSHTLARRALTALAEDNLVVRTRGHGSSVRGHHLLLPLEDLIARDGAPVLITEISRHVVTASRFVREAIGIHTPQVGMIEHLYLCGEQPVGLRVAYFAAEVQQRHRSGESPPLAQAFEETFGLPLARVDSTVEAIACDAGTALVLGVAEGAPLLMREQRLVGSDGATREISFGQYRADSVAFALGSAR